MQRAKSSQKAYKFRQAFHTRSFRLIALWREQLEVCHYRKENQSLELSNSGLQQSRITTKEKKIIKIENRWVAKTHFGSWPYQCFLFFSKIAFLRWIFALNIYTRSQSYLENWNGFRPFKKIIFSPIRTFVRPLVFKCVNIWIKK